MPSGSGSNCGNRFQELHNAGLIMSISAPYKVSNQDILADPFGTCQTIMILASWCSIDSIALKRGPIATDEFKNGYMRSHRHHGGVTSIRRRYMAANHYAMKCLKGLNTRETQRDAPPTEEMLPKQQLNTHEKRK